VILRKLGFYKELAYGSDDQPSLTQREPLAPDLKARVVAYLESAPVVAASQAICCDYFTGTPVGSQNFQTDGIWVWFSDLTYYVREYDTVLDADFVAGVQRGGGPHVTAEQMREVVASLGTLGQS